jgi:hypothetical protein
MGRMCLFWPVFRLRLSRCPTVNSSGMIVELSIHCTPTSWRSACMAIACCSKKPISTHPVESGNSYSDEGTARQFVRLAWNDRIRKSKGMGWATGDLSLGSRPYASSPAMILVSRSQKRVRS